MNDQSSTSTHGKSEKHQRCELCNVPIFGNPRSDIRSSDVFHGKGSVLCNKCAPILKNMPTKQAVQALDNASEIYIKAKE
ncbi:hypothetical protein CPJCM30710_11210 [Clostridium polyendosporum]|uniref:Uncharacterized protein n=1 Tax=Clostridium polyendosporum TaxID=69208 RepID=A0A919VFI4_9CLOT|nr:hypothetical protein [Clostridium polyendosporum]GIM28455.1 hypothetical protein CPJCM30710_11210 [Clostridium polyendosporum]